MKDPHQDRITQWYNSGADTFKNSMLDFSFPGDAFDFFLSLVPGKKILDIGCGFGRDVDKMRKLGFEAYGIDISEKLISEAKKEVSPFLRIGDITELEKYYSPESFSGVLCSASILHFEKNVAKGVLQQSYDILQENGAFFLSTKIRKSNEPEIVEKESISTPGVIKKYVYYTEQELEHILGAIGFQIVRTHSHTPLGDTWGIFICKK